MLLLLLFLLLLPLIHLYFVLARHLLGKFILMVADTFYINPYVVKLIKLVADVSRCGLFDLLVFVCDDCLSSIIKLIDIDLVVAGAM